MGYNSGDRQTLTRGCVHVVQRMLTDVVVDASPLTEVREQNVAALSEQNILWSQISE